VTFVQGEFLWLMSGVFGLYWLVRSRRGQNAVLLAASALFYGWVHPWFVGLLAASTLLDFFAGRAMARWPRLRTVALVASVVGNLGLLSAFKYHDFFVANVAVALDAVGLGSPFAPWALVLPVGISFYTFQTMSYTIDVYRGQLEPRADLLDYAVYVSFFPQLVAGPIERAGRLLPQVERPRAFDSARIRSGLALAMWGAFKKICIADVVALYVDKVYLLEAPSTPLLVAGTMAFGVQILADFSGYTDIARGVARMLGFELTENFRRPFLATSTPDFWRRWHISLGTWIGDYVFAPLSRALGPGPGRMVAAMLITFLLIGLWHGAAWNFVLLGLWYGAWMVVYTLGAPLVRGSGWGARATAIGVHSLVVLLPAGVLFREVSIERVVGHLGRVTAAWSADDALMAWIVLVVAGLLASPMVLAAWFEDHVWPKLRHTEWALPLQTSGIGLQVVAIALFYRDTSRDFVYFQF